MTSGSSILILLAVGLGAVGTYLLLPHNHKRARPRFAHAAGYLLVVLAAVALALLWSPPATFLASLFFYAFSLLAILGGILMVTSRNPVHSALWFATVILATSGLFLLAGAQFLAAGTVIVYAGAIIVTFLFVIMLAQSEGLALYDRLARAPGWSVLTSFLLLGTLSYGVLMVKTSESRPVDGTGIERRLVGAKDLPSRSQLAENSMPAQVIAHAWRPTSDLVAESSALAKNGIPPAHVAGLGGTLYTDHLLTVEIAGTLLFVALVGAAAIATPKPPVRPENRQQS